MLESMDNGSVTAKGRQVLTFLFFEVSLICIATLEGLSFSKLVKGVLILPFI